MPHDYTHCRDAIKSGDLLAWSHHGFRSWYDWKIQLVRMVTRSEYSHVGIAWVISGRVFVIESVTPFVRIVPLSNLLPCYWVHLPVQWDVEAEEYALSLVGNAHYSMWEAVRAFFGLEDNPDAWECAELVKAVYARCGLALDGRATPSDVMLAAQKMGGGVVLLEEA